MQGMADALISAGCAPAESVREHEMKTKLLPLSGSRDSSEFRSVAKTLLIADPALAVRVYKMANELWYTRDKALVAALKALKNSLQELPKDDRPQFVRSFFENSRRYAPRE